MGHTLIRSSRAARTPPLLALPILLIALALASPAASAQGSGDGAAADSGATAELWGGALAARIDSLAEATLAERAVAGISIGVKRGDDLLLAKGYGKADLENDVPATAETVYRIGSITKQFTAAAIMQLVEEGRVGLHDPITEHLPDYPTQGNEVTVLHLLTHTSGIKSYTSLEEWRPKMPLDLSDEELVALFQDEPFDFEPGERYQYNNSGFYLLGMIVEAAGGEPYAEYLDRSVFGRLGLGGSSYCDERRIIRHRAEGYQLADGELRNDQYLSMNHPGAAGALCSTVLDLLSWSAALRGGRVVSVDSYQRMTTPATLNDGSATEYGFGLHLGSLEGHRHVSHGGGINGFNTWLAHFPEAELDVVVLSNTNGSHPARIGETIAKWALGIPVPVVLDLSLPEEELERYVGVYELRPGFELTVRREEDELFARATGQGESRLRAQGDHVFAPTFDDEVRIVFDGSQDPAPSLVLHQGGQEVEAERIE